MPALEILVLVKRLEQAKTRLAPMFDAAPRARLVRAMLSDLLDVLRAVDRPAWIGVMTADPRIGDQVLRSGFRWLRQPSEIGLNPSAEAAHRHARGLGRPLLLLPADLPFARVADIEAVIAAGGPSRIAAVRSVDGGTNALYVPPDLDFRFAFGPASFRAHRSEAERLGAGFSAVLAPGLVEDIDTPASLLSCAGRIPGAYSRAVLRDCGAAVGAATA